MTRIVAGFTALAALTILIGCSQETADEKSMLDAESLLADWLSTAKQQDQQLLIHVGAPG